MICEQRGVFRVNCVDCLDRTNVVQTAIARIVMETQVNYYSIAIVTLACVVMVTKRKIVSITL